MSRVPARAISALIPKKFKRGLISLLARSGYELHKISHDVTQPAGGHDFLDALSGGFDVATRPLGERRHIVSRGLFDRITAASIAQFELFLADRPELKQALDQAPAEHYRREVLRLGNYYLPEHFNRDTGLSAFSPPQAVHAMVREEVFCGDLYYCDLVTEAMHGAGREILPGRRYLDFGCSSGRVVKTLAAYYSQARFFGCDPLQGAIDWASQNLPGISFSCSGTEPPLDYPDAYFDMIYAISIWSHYGQSSGHKWLREMHRILQSGGLLVWTTHGIGSLLYYHQQAAMSAADIRYALGKVLNEGFCFLDVFAGHGDWGLKQAEWGQAFINPVYVLRELLAGYKLVLFLPRRAENNQDVYVFEKI